MGKCQIIAIANQKGGVGKTTTTFSLGVALSKQGKRVLLTLVDKRTNLSKDVRANLIDNYGQYVKIYGAEIPKAINTAKSTSTGKSIFEFDKNSPVANAYNNLAKEVLENERTRQKDGTSKVRSWSFITCYSKKTRRRKLSNDFWT